MTSSREPEGDLVLLDACCLINLFASGHVGEILRALPYRWAIARYVVEEEILEIEDEDLLEELDVGSEEEQAELVRFAAELDDGEAQTCALAIVRHGRVATDDRKAIRVLRTAWKSRGHEGEPVLRTSELLFSWADADRIARPNLIRIVRAIARRASFFPPRSDPYFERWMELLEATK